MTLYKVLRPQQQTPGACHDTITLTQLELTELRSPTTVWMQLVQQHSDPPAPTYNKPGRAICGFIQCLGFLCSM